MHRIIAVLIVVLSFCAGPVFAGEGIPDLKGTWKVTRTDFHAKGKGIILSVDHVSDWKINEQEGRIIHGTVEWDIKGKNHKGGDDFSGVIAKDNKTLYIAGHGEGIRIGNIEGPNSITMYFIVPGGSVPRAGYADLERVQ